MFERLEDEEDNDESEDSEEYIKPPRLIAIIGDEDTCVGFVLAGIGEVDEFENPNYFIVDQKTNEYTLEKIFNNFTHREDIGLILITKEAADKISTVVKHYKSVDPAVLVIPGHNGPYEIQLPPGVQEIEDRREAQRSRRGSLGSVASLASLKTLASHHSSVHTIKSSKLDTNLNKK
ncbi:V-type proton ATPase subunit F-like [Sitophilus oryzae]|uniref:V-type proton ATPase subunit F-like n=1 Tax=Sitophilus oryzae TaxID=7048 RepID=A0A6J2YBI3_SITOR|nr:V-type proton ATPase subunit F-like [Sitophilus oryzae]